MDATPLDEEQIYHAARALDDPDARASYLRDACAGDAPLFDRVAALLLIAERESRFLEVPPFVTDPGVPPAPELEGPGTSIGPYKLMEAIGEGGMGVVYVADQTRPVRRRVALKVIKPGMDTRQVVARFEAERQALAMMAHPNIACVLDCGTAPSGRPYFVMELVRGLPITEYCDREKLSIRERLELFTLVCRAVQHAHQKGIIHRDLKPSNVLVTVIDGQPVPKVIDFGIAKATGPALTDKTIYTAFHQFVGTPLYVSPEQAELSGVDVDTRSDIYSLGVLLYELLTGTTPFDSETLRKAAFDEMRRILREEEPPRPSARLSTLGETLSTISARRKADPKRLGASFRGELDWVVMKSLEKSRQRRYQTANDLAADLQRYLSDQPVEAGRPSPLYRMGKYARRHRAELAVVSVIVLILSCATAFSAWQASRARAAESRAEADFQMARDAVDRMLVRVSDEMATVPGAVSVRRALLGDTLAFYQSFLAAHRGDPRVTYDAARASYRVAKIRWDIGDLEGTREPLDRAIALLDGLIAEEPARQAYRFDKAECHTLRAQSLLMRSRQDRRASEELRAAMGLFEGLVAADATNGTSLRRLAGARFDLGISLVERRTNDDGEAGPHIRAALADWERIQHDFPAEPGDAAELSRLRIGMGHLHLRHGELAQAESEFRAALALAWGGPGKADDHPASLARAAEAQRAMASLLFARGDRAEGERVLREAIARSEPIYRGYADVFTFLRPATSLLRGLAHSQWEGGRAAEACETFARLVALQEAASKAHDHEYNYIKALATCLAEHGQALHDAGRPVESRAAFLRAIQIFEGARDRYPRHTFLQTEAAWWLTICPEVSVRDPARAARIATRALATTPAFQDAHDTLGIAAYRLGDLATARARLERALELDPNDPAPALFLAMTFARQGDMDRARHWYAVGTRAREPWYPSARIFEQVAAEARELIPGAALAPIRSGGKPALLNKPGP